LLIHVHDFIGSSFLHESMDKGIFKSFYCTLSDIGTFVCMLSLHNRVMQLLILNLSFTADTIVYYKYCTKSVVKNVLLLFFCQTSGIIRLYPRMGIMGYSLRLHFSYHEFELETINIQFLLSINFVYYKNCFSK
jgi:hypothetical protein